MAAILQVAVVQDREAAEVTIQTIVEVDHPDQVLLEADHQVARILEAVALAQAVAEVVLQVLDHQGVGQVDQEAVVVEHLGVDLNL